MKRIISSLWVAFLVLTTLSFGTATSVAAAGNCHITDLGRQPGGPNTHKITFAATSLPTTQSYHVSADWRGHQTLIEQDFSLDGGSNGSWDSGDIVVALTPPPTNQIDVLSMIVKNRVTGVTECTQSIQVIPPTEEEAAAGLPASNTSSQQGGGLGTPQECIQTQLGCIPTDPGRLANAIFSILLGLAGGLAILMIIVGGFKVAMSQGNPDALEDGRDTITKAVTGLVFILLATTILGIIGIDILGLGRFFQRTPGGIIITP
jgi:hypothetical protein